MSNQTTTALSFKDLVLQGIPNELPQQKNYDPKINHAPKRKDSLNADEKKLAIRNALRYFDAKHHTVLAKEFAEELKAHGRIYMHRFRPDYKIYARPINEYPCKSIQAAAIMHMLSNNLDHAVAQHPHELITYGGNGSVFQNWAQYLITMQYLANMTDEQTLVLYSGHPAGLFPSHKDAPRVVVTNGMMIPNYSKPDDLEKFNALGVTQYGQMTAGSFMYIGPQGRILYADSEGRIKIAKAINTAIKEGKITAPVVLGRDHHDVSGTDSPYRETSNIYDGSKFTADMAVQNFVGDSFRGATWISLHNGGGVGWGEVINGGFGLVLDGTADAERRLEQMLFWDVNNGVSRRAWARNDEALFAIKREMDRTPNLKVTLPNLVNDNLLEGLF